MPFNMDCLTFYNFSECLNQELKHVFPLYGIGGPMQIPLGLVLLHLSQWLSLLLRMAMTLQTKYCIILWRSWLIVLKLLSRDLDWAVKVNWDQTTSIQEQFICLLFI